jgi:serpin B
MRKSIVCVIFLLTLAGADLKAEDGPSGSVPLTRADLVRANNQFAVDLYHRLQSHEGNLFFSPFSLSASLALTAAGAQGETAQQMARVLDLPNDLPRAHAAFGSLRKELEESQSPHTYRLHTANSLWGPKDLQFLPGFQQVAGECYGAAAKAIDFQDNSNGALTAINDWVEQQTRSQIRDFLKPGSLDAQTRLLLVNAVYFKGEWGHPFKRERNREGPFHARSQRSIPATYMNQTSKLAYLDANDFQALEIPYSGSAVSMLVFLPKTPGGLTKLEKSMTAEHLEKWLSRLEPCEVELSLPKFQLAAEIQLQSTLAAMGMTLPFSAAADFSRLCSSGEPLQLTAVVHKAVVEVNEEGTEASAATAVKAARGIANPNRPTFHADHPFLFLIRHNPSASILFLGRLVEPPAAKPSLAAKPRGLGTEGDAGKLEGSWVLAAAEEDGRPKPTDLVKTGRLLVLGDKFILKIGEKVYTGREKLDAARQPKEIDLTMNDGPYKGKVMRGIYELDGDQHRTCVSIPGKQRPTAFTTSPGGYLLQTWKRGGP